MTFRPSARISSGLDTLPRRTCCASNARVTGGVRGVLAQRSPSLRQTASAIDSLIGPRGSLLICATALAMLAIRGLLVLMLSERHHHRRRPRQAQIFCKYGRGAELSLVLMPLRSVPLRRWRRGW